jgi:hypothetical protein
MTIRRSRADAGRARGIGKGEAARPLLSDQLDRGTHQGFLQVAMVIAARLTSTVFPAHVKGLYMSREPTSMPP